MATRLSTLRDDLQRVLLSAEEAIRLDVLGRTDAAVLVPLYVQNDELWKTSQAKLREALKVKATWDKARQDIQAVNARVQAITADQKRLRENLRETPKESPLFQRYLKTLEEQEKEMDDLSARLKALHGDEAKSKAAYDDFLAHLSAE